MTSVQNVFIMPTGGMREAMAEVERRKFTAEEGDHLTLLNGEYNHFAQFGLTTAYNAFVRYGQKDKQWCGNHRLNFKALSRAVSIRKQLKKYLERFGIPSISCEGDAVRLRKCLVSGYFKNAARMLPDGSYRSAREGAVRLRKDFTDTRFCTSTPRPSCSPANRQLAGSSSTRWSRQPRASCGTSLSSTRNGSSSLRE